MRLLKQGAKASLSPVTGPIRERNNNAGGYREE